MSTLRRLFYSFLILNFALLTFSSPVLAQGKDWKTIQSGRCVKSGAVMIGGIPYTDLKTGIHTVIGGTWKTYDDVATIQGFECLFYNILQYVMVFAGLAFFIMFIYNGFEYMTSGNDPKKIAGISTALLNSILGIVGIVASWLILSFIANFTGVNVLNFLIPPNP